MNLASAPVPAADSPRLYFLDWVRIGAFALLIAYHVGMYYVSWDWHVKSPNASPALEPFMRLSEPWRMGLLFVVSGAAASLMLARGGASPSFLRARTGRLLLPLLLGLAIVVPPQAYFEVVEKAGYGGSYLDFLALYFSGYGGFCQGKDCLVLPTWNHLWFLPYLFFYTGLLWATLRRWPDVIDGLAAVLGRWLAGAGLWLLPLIVLALLRILLLSRFGSTHALIDDWHNHAVYGFLFVLGVGLVRAPALFQRMAEGRWAALLTALCCWGLLQWYFAIYEHLPPPDGLRAFQRGVHATLQWTAIMAVLGFARRHLDADHRWRAPLNEAVFPCYILHQTLIILGAVALRGLQLPVVVEVPLLLALAFGGSLLGWRLLRRVPLLHPWFGIASSARQPLPAAAKRGASPRD